MKLAYAAGWEIHWLVIDKAVEAQYIKVVYILSPYARKGVTYEKEYTHYLHSIGAFHAVLRNRLQ